MNNPKTLSNYVSSADDVNTAKAKLISEEIKQEIQEFLIKKNLLLADRIKGAESNISVIHDGSEKSKPER